MDKLLTIIKDYVIEQDTEYAILINGDWGCGKTFYWKNTIYSMLKSLNVNGNKFHPIYISLFGLNNVDDIIDKIAIQYYAPRVTKNAIISAIRISVQKKLQIDNFRDIVHTLFSFNNVIICFDDLERTAIPIKEVLGYINSLIEHNNFKVLIICNEKEIKNDDNIKSRDIYDIFKEKTIGITYKINPDYLQIVLDVLKSYGVNNDFYRFLITKKDIIYNIFIRSETNNIRVLKHSLCNFWKIFHYLFSIDCSYPNKYGTGILIFLLVISFELKGKPPTEKKLREIEAYVKDDYGYLSAMMFEREEGTETFYQEVIDKYYIDMGEYKYTSQAIYNYIMHGFFNVKDFIVEILNKAKEEDPEELIIRNVLSRYWTMSDQEFEEAIHHILNRINQGKIDSISLYIRLFLSFLSFIDNNLLNIKNNDLIQIFKKGMELAYSNKILKYDKIDDSSLCHVEPKYLKDSGYQEINEFGENIIDKNNDDILRAKCIKYFNLFESNLPEFIQQITSDELNYSPCFKYIDPSDLFDKIIKLNNNDLIEFRNTLMRRNKFPGVKDRNKEEKEIFLLVKDNLESYIKQRGDKLSTYLYKILIYTLGDICKD